MKSLCHILSVYKLFVRNSVREASSFRLHFVLVILMDILFMGTTLKGVEYMYDHFDFLGGWDRSQTLFFIAYILLLDALNMTFISANLWDFSEDLKKGQIDFVLLRPISGPFQVFFHYFRVSSLLNMTLAFTLIIYYGLQAKLTLLSWTSLLPLIGLSFSLLVLIQFTLSTAMFWTLEGIGINFFRMQLQNLSRWPDDVYRLGLKRLFYLAFPLTLIGSAPVRFLFDSSDWDYLAIMVAFIVFFLFLFQSLWRRGLKAYESASS